MAKTRVAIHSEQALARSALRTRRADRILEREKVDRIRFETDEDGFRNAPGGARAEIVVLGDSFAGGDLVDGNDVATWSAPF